MSKIDFQYLTDRFPEQVMSMSELIKEHAFAYGELNKVVSIVGDVRHQKKIGFLGKMGMIGQTGTGTGCAYNKVERTIDTSEKEWNPQEYNHWLTLCSDDIADTVASLTLKYGVDVHDLEETEYLDYFVEALEISIAEMYWRIIFHGDKNAANVNASPPGVITAGLDVKYVNMIDGLWKRAETIAASHPEQYKTIAANLEVTTAAQYAAFDKATALAHAKSLYNDAPLRIKAQMKRGEYRAYCTIAYFDQLKENFKGFELESMKSNLEDGMDIIKVQGLTFEAVPEWDKMIDEVENLGARVNNPFRVLVYNKTNALVGVPSMKTWGQFKMTFSEETDKFYIKLKDKIDALFLHDNDLMIGF